MNITPNTTVRFYTNVPFFNNYQNVRQFDNVASQTEYFNSLQQVAVLKCTYQRDTGGIKVPYSRDYMLKYDYMSFVNTAFSDKVFYCFIDSITYLSPNSCLVNFTVDVYQTFLFDVQFRPSYIERQHCKRWNADGSPVINTVNEGLDYGSEYVTKSISFNENDLYWLVFVTSLTEDEIYQVNGEEVTGSLGTGILSGVPNELVYLVYPIYAKQPSLPVQIKTEHIQSMTGSLEDLLYALRVSPTLVNKVKNIYLTPYLPLYYEYKLVDRMGGGGQAIEITTRESFMQLARIKFDLRNAENHMAVIKVGEDLSTNWLQDVHIANKYDGLHTDESKLMMYPYSYSELKDNQGNTFIIKNEYVDGNDYSLIIHSSLDSNPKYAVIVDKYLGEIHSNLDHGIIVANPNNISFIDDYASAYIQGNKNQIENSIAETKRRSQFNIDSTRSQGLVGQASALSQGIDSVLGGANNSAVSQGNALAMSGNTSGFSPTGNALLNVIGNTINAFGGIQRAELASDVNNALARQKANIDNEYAVKGAMAKIQDAKMVADTVYLQGGNTQFTYGNDLYDWKIVRKQITQEYVDILSDYFKKYGYAYHRVETPNVHTRQSYNYIRTVDCNIVGNISDIYLTQIRNIYNNGVTIWHTNDIGNYNLPNNEV